jgi:hypothetical protein
VWLDPGSGLVTDSLLPFSVTSVASSVAVQKYILANQKVINPQVHNHVDLGRGKGNV